MIIKIIFAMFIAGGLFFVSMMPVQAQTELVYRFDGTAIDNSQWTIVHRAGNKAAKSGGELQEYVPEAVVVDGVLHLLAERNSVVDSKTGLEMNYTSGRIESKRTFVYGKFTYRARLPKGKGFWPALWLRTPLHGGPINGEIDVLENRGSRISAYQATRHVWEQGKHIRQDCMVAGVYPNQKVCPNNPDVMPPGTDLSADFHDYSVEWEADHITWSFDGHPFFTLTEEIPQVPMVIVVDLVIGGTYAGPPNDNTPFPSSLDVEEIRVQST